MKIQLQFVFVYQQCGDIIEVEKIGRFIKQKIQKYFFILDACQSLGQININVKNKM